MSFLPIVERELRSTARRRGTYWRRTAAAAVAVGMFALLLYMETGRPPREVGRSLFGSLAVVLVLAASLGGVLYTADALSEEKRENTLGLLFLTDLRGYDVVLGKLAASSLGASYGLLATVPIMAVPLLVGGVTWQEFVRVGLVLVNMLFFSLAAGMLASAWATSGVTAMALTAGIVLSVHLGPPLLGLWIAHRAGGASVPEEMLMPSAGYALASAFESGGANPRQHFWSSLGLTLFLSCCLLVLASISVRYGWQDEASRFWRPRGWRLPWARSGAAPARNRRIRQTLGENPALYLGLRDGRASRGLWLALGSLFVVWLALFASGYADFLLGEGSCLLLALLLHAFLRCHAGAVAAQALGPDRRSGALELLLSTPLGVRSLVQGRMLALERVYFGPVLTVVAADLVLLAASLRRNPSGEDVMWLSVYGALIVVLAVDMFAIGWAGLWQGLVQRWVSRAIVRVLWTILLLPWVVILGLVLLAAITDFQLPGGDDYRPFLLFYVLVCVGISGWAVRHYRSRLLGELRVVVSERAAPGLPPEDTRPKA